MSKNDKVSVGGQALIEGIMMQGPKGCAMSLRMPDGSIETTEKEVKHIRDKVPFLGKPIIRGVVNFVESMILGYKCLMESAEKTSLEFEEEENMSKFDRWILDHFGEKMMPIISVISSVLSFLLGFGLFMWLPTAIANGLNSLTGDSITGLCPLIEGLLRMAIFVGYMFAVSQMKDIKRVFMYHGAEHKAIFCYENGLPLTVENVKAQSRLHPRCGTSFIFVVLIISILISSIIGLIPGVRESTFLWLIIKLVVLLPLVAGLAYEFIKYAGKNEDKKWVCVLSKPGLWMQKITTREPTDDIIEVAIAALNGALYGIEATEGAAAEVTEDDYTDIIKTNDRANEEPEFFKEELDLSENKPQVAEEEPVVVKDEAEDLLASSFDDILKEIEKFAPKYNPSPKNFEDELQLMDFDNND